MKPNRGRNNNGYSRSNQQNYQQQQHNEDDQDAAWAEYDRTHGNAHPNNPHLARGANDNAQRYQRKSPVPLCEPVGVQGNAQSVLAFQQQMEGVGEDTTSRGPNERFEEVCVEFTKTLTDEMGQKFDAKEKVKRVRMVVKKIELESYCAHRETTESGYRPKAVYRSEETTSSHDTNREKPGT